MPETNELRYFSSKQVLSKLGGPGDGYDSDKVCQDLDTYTHHFQSVNPNQVIGECTSSYFFFPEAIDNILAELGHEVKLILVLRNPIDRAYSNYWHLVREGREELSFFEALQDETRREQQQWNDFWYYKAHSLYSEKLSSLKAKVKNVMVLLFEDLRDETEDTLRQVYRFLEVDETFESTNSDIHYNAGGAYRNAELVNWMNQPSKLRRVAKSILPSPMLNRLRRKRDRMIQQAAQPKPTMPLEPSEMLAEYFAEDVSILSQEHGLDTGKWNLSAKPNQ